MINSCVKVFQNAWKFDVGPRSEQWRIWWSFRTCISVAVMTFLYLYKPTQSSLFEFSNPAFTAFVTVLVKDETVGASLWNSWVCIFGSLLSTIVCYFIQLGLGNHYSLKEGFPVSICLVLLLVAVFIFQYAEIPLMGKKLGVSILAINLTGFVQTNIDPKNVWNFYISVLLGCAFGMIGTVFPLPIQFAGTEMQYRLRYHSQVLSSLYHSVTLAWMHQPFQIYKVPTDHDNREEMFLSTSIDSHSSSHTYSTKPLKNPHWRRVRNILLVLIAFKRAKYYRLSWIHQQARLSKDRYIRMELVKYLEDELDTLMKKNNEAKFGPNRSLAIRIFSRYLLLLRRFLTILYRLEQLIVNVEQQARHHYIFRQFFYSPTFREKLWIFVKAIIQSMEGLTHVCIQSPTIKESMTKLSHDGKEILPDELIPVEVVHQIANMINAKREFDHEYFLIRKQIYYDYTKPMHSKFPSDHVFHHSAQENNRQPASVKTMTGEQVGYILESDAGEIAEESVLLSAQDKKKSSLHKKKSIYSPTDFDDHHDTECFPLVNSVLFNMNSFLFLLDTTSDLITHFWNLEELKDIQQDMVSYYHEKQLHKASPEISNNTTNALFQNPMIAFFVHSFNFIHTRSLKAWKTCQSLVTDLFPSQRHLVFLSYSFEKRAFVWSFTPVIIARLKGALVVSLSMTLAAIYGIFADRPQSFLASFTIAYLAGGSAAGMNIMTCMNRAAGTVIACVYAIIVIYMYNTDIFQSSALAQNFLIGISLVLFQIPCTYIRSYNLYSYSGTVAGFTAALLLIDPRQLSPDQSINRIIDTYVGVTIYIAFELILFAQFIEDILLNDMKVFVEGIEKRFSHFHSYFERFQLVSQRLRSSSQHQQVRHAQEIATKTVPTTNTKQVLEIITDANVDDSKVGESPQHLLPSPTKMLPQDDGTIIDYHQIYRSFDDSHDDEERQTASVIKEADRAGAGEEVDLSLEEDLTLEEFFSLFTHRRMTGAPLRFELESLHTIVNRQRLMIPFYDAEPKLLGPPSLPTRLIEECLYWQNQAMKNLQVMFWVVEACDGSRDQTIEEFILYINHQYETRQYQERHRQEAKHRIRNKEETHSNNNNAAAYRPSTARKLSGMTHIHHRMSSITLAAPDYETFLLPLQQQFVQVESFVSTSTTFLSSAIIQLKQNHVAKAVWYEQTHGRDPLRLLSSIHVRRFPNESTLPLAEDIDNPVDSAEAGTARPIQLDIETSRNAVHKLFKDYQLILTGLQSNIFEKDTVTTSKDILLHIASNKEIKTVNALLSSTYDLVAALKGLAGAISRLQASRDIRITQNARHLD